jgi:hypothetical protein
MESEQSNNFNQRLSQWVANQGFWFQLRYSLSGSGNTGTAFYQLLRMSFRVLIFLLVVSAGVMYFLVKRPATAKFMNGLTQELKEGFSATEAEIRGFTRIQGELGIYLLSLQGGKDTFYDAMVLRDIRCKMGYTDGLTGVWDTGTVSVSRLVMELRAGADDAKSSEMFSKAIFKESERVAIKTIEIADANISWGYSERTRGGIEHSVLKIQRLENGLRLNFKGGTLSQNWLRKIEIVDLVIVCDPDGMVFEKGLLRDGPGTVDFSGLKVVGGERPVISGTAKIRKLDLEGLLPMTLRNYIEGSISGDFKVTGSTNSSDGIAYAGQVTLDGEDKISLRDRIHLLKALSTVDYVRNYHRVDFSEGSFQMKTNAGGMEISDLNLKGDELMTLEGKLRVRLPTPEEARAAVEKGTRVGGAPLFSGDVSEAENTGPKLENSDFTLRKAAEATKRAKEQNSAEWNGSLYDRLGLSLEMRRLQEQASERASRTLMYEGAFRITLQADAFDRAPKLASQFPVDPKSGRVPLVVPIEGNIYEITLKQAEDIYQQGRRQ